MKNPKSDPMDYDGMGDFSRFRNANDDRISLENMLKSWIKKYFTIKAEK
ncbi:MAG: hypothetical protein RI564_06335 [Gracilimonas sp.]|jgi:hypothetical protein|nr:hypothetical protein [Gracilimonas sp.]